MKKITLLAFALAIYMAGNSQTIKENLDKQSKDPATAEKAAKADVLIQRLAAIDSTAVIKKEHPFASVRKKKKNCKTRNCR